MAILTKAQLKAENSSSFPNNNSQAITPQILRDYNVDIIDTLVDSNSTASFARTDLTNQFSATNNFTSISASSFVSASAFTGDGSRLTNITASVALPILDEGVLQGYATSMNFTGSAISAQVIAGTAVVQVNIDNVGLVTTASFNAYTSSTNAFTASTNQFTQSVNTSITNLNASSASQQVSINALNVYTASQSTASIDNSITELNTFSASAKIELVNLNTSVTNLNSFSSSTNSSITQLNANTASQQVSINSLNAATASYVTETESGSFLLTASFDNGTRNLTFTKGNNTTFNVNIPDVSGSTINTASFATTGSNTFVGGQNVNGQLIVDTGGNQLILKSGESGSTIFSQQPSGSPYNGTLSIFQTQGASGIDIYSNVNIIGNLTASLQQGYVWVGNSNNRTSLVATSSFASTINTGSFATTGSNTFNGVQTIRATGGTPLIIDHSDASPTQNTLISILKSGSAEWSLGNLGTDDSFILYNPTTFATPISVAQNNNVTFTGNISAFSASFTYLQTIFESSSVIYSSGSNIFGDELSDTQTLSGSVKVQGSLTVNGTPVLTSSVDISGLTTTASFNAYTQSNDSKVNSLINATASYATSAITASSVVTASAVGNTITFTKGDASTFNVSVSSTPIDTGSFATTGSNSFNGNQIINGNVTISGSATSDLTVVGQIFVSSSATGGTTAPKITVSGSAGQTTINRSSITTRDTTYTAGVLSAGLFTSTISTSDEIGFAVDPTFYANWSFGPAIYVNNDALDSYNAVFGFQNKANLTDGRVAVLTPLSASAGFTASLQNGYAWVGNSLGQNTQVATSSFGSTIDTGSFVTTSSFNSYTSSNDQKVNSLISATGSYATTGSNSFNGNQTISGSLLVSGSATTDVTVVGKVVISGPTTAGQTPTLIITGSDNASTTIGRFFNNINSAQVNGVQDTFGQIYANTASLAGQYIGVYDDPNFNTVVEIATEVTKDGISFKDYDNGSTFSYIPFLTIAPNLGNNPAPVMTRGLQVTGSTQVQNFTASLQQGFTYVGNATGRTTTVATSSFATNVSNLATTGSNSFVGNQTITGSLILSSSNAVELQIIGNTEFTGSLIMSSSNAVELTIIGNMVVTGSAFGNVVSMSITANTASMDLSRGNYFTLTLADTATTHISASNVQPGVSATLVITTGTNSSASLAPTMLQPSGSAYSATNGSAKKDVLSIVAVASNVPFVVSTKNMI